MENYVTKTGLPCQQAYLGIPVKCRAIKGLAFFFMLGFDTFPCLISVNLSNQETKLHNKPHKIVCISRSIKISAKLIEHCCFSMVWHKSIKALLILSYTLHAI